MSTYSSCPWCHRNARETFSSNYFPVYRCNDCGQKYCKECGRNGCPKCGSTRYMEVGKVYAR